VTLVPLALPPDCALIADALVPLLVERELRSRPAAGRCVCLRTEHSRRRAAGVRPAPCATGSGCPAPNYFTEARA